LLSLHVIRSCKNVPPAPVAGPICAVIVPQRRNNRRDWTHLRIQMASKLPEYCSNRMGGSPDDISISQVLSWRPARRVYNRLEKASVTMAVRCQRFGRFPVTPRMASNLTELQDNNLTLALKSQANFERQDNNFPDRTIERRGVQRVDTARCWVLSVSRHAFGGTQRIREVLFRT
jgi:hypothetical protein